MNRISRDDLVRTLRLFAAASSSADLQRELGLTEPQMKRHVRKVLTMMGARNRAHAVAIGFRQGLLS